MGKPDQILCPAALYNGKDHRTNFESGNPSAVIDGDLDGFMNAYLAWDNNSKKEEN